MHEMLESAMEGAAEHKTKCFHLEQQIEHMKVL